MKFAIGLFIGLAGVLIFLWLRNRENQSPDLDATPPERYVCDQCGQFHCDCHVDHGESE